MKALGRVFNAFGARKTSRNKATLIPLPELRNQVVDGIVLCIKDLESGDYNGSLYFESGEESETSSIVKSIVNGSVNEEFLLNISNPFSIGIAIRKVLLSHAPICTYELYDEFLNPDADIQSVIYQLPKLNREFLEYIVKHLVRLAHHRDATNSISSYAISFAPELLRSLESNNENGIDGSDSSSKAQSNAILKLFKDSDTIFTPPDPKQSHKNNTKNINNIDDNTSVDNQQHARPDTNSVVDRSIMITFPKKRDPPEQDDLTDALSTFGEIIDIAMKQKKAVVLFADLLSARKCLEDWDTVLDEGYKVKAIGNPYKENKEDPKSPSLNHSESHDAIDTEPRKGSNNSKNMQQELSTSSTNTLIVTTTTTTTTAAATSSINTSDRSSPSPLHNTAKSTSPVTVPATANRAAANIASRGFIDEEEEEENYFRNINTKRSQQTTPTLSPVMQGQISGNSPGSSSKPPLHISAVSSVAHSTGTVNSNTSNASSPRENYASPRDKTSAPNVLSKDNGWKQAVKSTKPAKQPPLPAMTNSDEVFIPTAKNSNDAALPVPVPAASLSFARSRSIREGVPEEDDSFDAIAARNGVPAFEEDYLTPAVPRSAEDSPRSPWKTATASSASTTIPTSLPPKLQLHSNVQNPQLPPSHKDKPQGEIRSITAPNTTIKKFASGNIPPLPSTPPPTYAMADKPTITTNTLSSAVPVPVPMEDTKEEEEEDMSRRIIRSPVKDNDDDDDYIPIVRGGDELSVSPQPAGRRYQSNSDTHPKPSPSPYGNNLSSYQSSSPSTLSIGREEKSRSPERMREEVNNRVDASGKGGSSGVHSQAKDDLVSKLSSALLKNSYDNDNSNNNYSNNNNNSSHTSGANGIDSSLHRDGANQNSSRRSLSISFSETLNSSDNSMNDIRSLGPSKRAAPNAASSSTAYSDPKDNHRNHQHNDRQDTVLDETRITQSYTPAKSSLQNSYKDDDSSEKYRWSRKGIDQSSEVMYASLSLTAATNNRTLRNEGNDPHNVQNNYQKQGMKGNRSVDEDPGDTIHRYVDQHDDEDRDSGDDSDNNNEEKGHDHEVRLFHQSPITATPKSAVTLSSSSPGQSPMRQKAVGGSHHDPPYGTETESEGGSHTQAMLFSRHVQRLESELIARQDQLGLRQKELLMWESTWTGEISSLRMECHDLRNAAYSEREAARLLRAEMAKRDAELAACKASLEVAERTVEGAKARAEREALSTVLALKRLVTLLETQRNSAVDMSELLKREISDLSDAYDKASKEGMEWQIRALAAEQELSRILSQTAEVSVKEIVRQSQKLSQYSSPPATVTAPSNAITSTSSSNNNDNINSIHNQRSVEDEGSVNSDLYVSSQQEGDGEGYSSNSGVEDSDNQRIGVRKEKGPAATSTSNRSSRNSKENWEDLLPSKTMAKDQIEKYLSLKRHRDTHPKKTLPSSSASDSLLPPPPPPVKTSKNQRLEDREQYGQTKPQPQSQYGTSNRREQDSKAMTSNQRKNSEDSLQYLINEAKEVDENDNDNENDARNGYGNTVWFDSNSKRNDPRHHNYSASNTTKERNRSSANNGREREEQEAEAEGGVGEDGMKSTAEYSQREFASYLYQQRQPTGDSTRANPSSQLTGYSAASDLQTHLQHTSHYLDRVTAPGHPVHSTSTRGGGTANASASAWKGNISNRHSYDQASSSLFNNNYDTPVIEVTPSLLSYSSNEEDQRLLRSRNSSRLPGVSRERNNDYSYADNTTATAIQKQSPVLRSSSNASVRSEAAVKSAGLPFGVESLVLRDLGGGDGRSMSYYSQSSLRSSSSNSLFPGTTATVFGARRQYATASDWGSGGALGGRGAAGTERGRKY